MRMKLPGPIAGLLLGLGFLTVPARSQVLYDAGPGTLPAAQGWFYESQPVASVHVLSNNAALLSTASASIIQAGLVPGAALQLSRTNGVMLVFTLAVHSESHLSTNRAGCSLIVLGDDMRGIELGFWTNRIFAQSDTPAYFNHAEEAVFNTANAYVPYTLSLRATNYVLQAYGTNILSGPIRDYTGFSGLLDPYETPNLIFLGDNTTSANAALSLRRFALVTRPQLSAGPDRIVTWTGISNLTYRVEASTNLLQWGNIAWVASPTSTVTYTNPAGSNRRFLRVAYP